MHIVTLLYWSAFRWPAYFARCVDGPDGQPVRGGRNVIQVREGWREGRQTRLKTAGSHRDVDLLPAVRQALEEQRLIAGGNPLVFPSRLGGHIKFRNLRRRVWYPTLAKAGLRRRDLYNTRHPFATHALASGEDPGVGRPDARAYNADDARDALLPLRGRT